MKIKFAIVIVSLTLLSLTTNIFPQDAPGAPGKDAQWSSAGKQAVGTAVELESKIWFTLQGGALTDVYYPDVTIANVHKLEFVVVNPATKKVETETEDATHKIEVTNPNSLSFRQINTAKSGEWFITKTYVTDVERASVVIKVSFGSKNKNLILYVNYDPSLSNTGRNDTAWWVKGENDNKTPESRSLFGDTSSKNNALVAQDGKISSALMIDDDFEISGINPFYFGEITNGFLGINDGLTQLKEKKILQSYSRAENGNVVQFARIHNSEREEYDREKSPYNFKLALSFAETPERAIETAKKSLQKNFAMTAQIEYEKGWTNYVRTIKKVEPKYQAQFNMAAMVLRSLEDKTVRGANIASLSIPWGGGANANDDVGGGYHLVWSRDLYQVVTAYMALGDTAAANRALDFLFKIQQKPDGSFPQNSWLDGRCGWCSLQLDEVAYPLILAYQLGRNDKQTYENHVKKAADFLVKTGPKTPQERWEEKSGYSPSTIAAEIAGLVCAADIAKKNNDEASATIYLATADDWARNVERWTATTNGKYGDGNYYLRLTENGTPDANEKTVLNNNAGTFIEHEIVDAGFLELVRLGIKSPDDKLIQKSVSIVDQILSVKTPNGESFYRYNNDGYGEMDDGRRWNWDGKYTGKGRLWALLAGERGQYELALSKIEKFSVDGISTGDRAKFRLDAMMKFANEGLMIPEQIWDKPTTPANIDRQFISELKFGEGTGSATPLAWSMAQFIRLAVNLQAGRNLETPQIVYDRYVKNAAPSQNSSLGGIDVEFVLPVKSGEKFVYQSRATPNSTFAYSFKGETKLAKVNDKGVFSVEIIAPEAEEISIMGVIAPDGSTAFSRAKVVPANLTKKSEIPAFDAPNAGESAPKIVGKKNEQESYVQFVYRGDAQTVEIAGDFTGWQPRGLKFTENKNVKTLILPFRSDAQFEYKIIADGKWILDPANPNKWDNGVGDFNSFFVMPGYQKSAWTDTTGMTKDNIDIFKINSQKFGEREIQVYRPESKEPLPVLYLFDGNQYSARAEAITIQRNLIKAGKIKPFTIVMIGSKDRTKEYFANDDWADFIAGEVVPEIDKKYQTVKNRDGRALLGASLGGITSLHIAAKHPGKFARIGAQSASFWVDNGRVVRELESLDPAKNKFVFYLDDGVLEGVEDSRRVNVMLRARGFPVTYLETTTGHNWASWRDRLADAFVALWK